MVFITESQVRSFAGSAGVQFAESELRKVAMAAAPHEFDVFLSHAYVDAQLVLGVKVMLERLGLRVYVDWIIDNELDRSKVTVETASKLRERMGQCESLIYVATSASPFSKWMPWELGYFDGLKPNKVAILPIVKLVGDTFPQQEYLDLYPRFGDTITLSDGLVAPRMRLKDGSALTVTKFIESGAWKTAPKK